MESTLLPDKRQPATLATVPTRRSWIGSRQAKRLREALLAYAFLFPAFLIVGLFGLFPILFAAFQSTLRGLNRIVGTYDGLGNYVLAIGDLTYVLFFWSAALLVFFGGRSVAEAVRDSRDRGQNAWLWALPGVIIGGAIVLATWLTFRLLPLLLEIPGRLRGRNNTPENFRAMVVETLLLPEVQQLFWSTVAVFVVGVVLLVLVARMAQQRAGQRAAVNYAGAFISATVMLALAAVLVQLTLDEIAKVYAAALESGAEVTVWQNVVTISAGFLLLLVAWRVWNSASKADTNVGMALRLGSAAMLLVGAWLLIGELPAAISAGDRRWWLGVINTFWYSLGTIPVQLGLALILAVLLFQDLKGKSLFRIIFFIPYIAPFVGTAAVFRIIFSNRPSGPMNSILTSLNGTPLQWLNEPRGIFQLLLGPSVVLPEWASGPSLALIVIIIFGTWTFVGFNTVIFMAGLGNIPRELYEAGAIDGAGRWALFRSITLPMLSPTIYFLTLYSVIGTFKAFNHIYVLRTSAALGTTDTASVVIFQTIRESVRYGYASALAILLLVIILVLTVINNRVAKERVFYG